MRATLGEPVLSQTRGLLEQPLDLLLFNIYYLLARRERKKVPAKYLDTALDKEAVCELVKTRRSILTVEIHLVLKDDIR